MIIVTGLPRSGTSLMMQMLQKSGIPIVTDNERQPDENNTKGYLEHKGKAIKIVSPNLVSSKYIFMERDFEEIMMSMEKMMGHKPNREGWELQFKKAKEFMADKDVTYVNYNNLVNNPEEEIKKLPMVTDISAIDKSLYRNRS